MRAASATGCASATTSTRCGWSSEIEGGLNLTEQVRDGILHHTGPEPPATLEGRIVRLVDRIAYINHDIDDAIRAGVLALRATCRAAEIELLGATGSERIETLVVDLLERSEEAGDIVQGEEVGGAMLRLREFMFERVYLGPERAAPEAARIERMLRALFDALRRAPAAGADRRTPPRTQRVVDCLAGMTDRFAIRVLRGPVAAAGVLSDGAASPSDSIDRLREAVDMVELVGAQDRPAPRRHALDRACARSTTSARRRSRSTPRRSSTTASAARPRRRRVRLRRGDRGARLPPRRSSCSPSATASSWSARTRTRRRRSGGAGASGCCSCSSAPRASTRRTCGSRRRRRKAREYLAGRGLGEEVLRDVPRRLRARAPGTACWSGAQRDGFSAEELAAAGLAQRGRDSGGLYDRFRGRIMFPLADARGRVLGFGARAMRRGPRRRST